MTSPGTHRFRTRIDDAPSDEMAVFIDEVLHPTKKMWRLRGQQATVVCDSSAQSIVDRPFAEMLEETSDKAEEADATCVGLRLYRARNASRPDRVILHVWHRPSGWGTSITGTDPRVTGGRVDYAAVEVARAVWLPGPACPDEDADRAFVRLLHPRLESIDDLDDRVISSRESRVFGPAPDGAAASSAEMSAFARELSAEPDIAWVGTRRFVQPDEPGPPGLVSVRFEHLPSGWNCRALCGGPALDDDSAVRYETTQREAFFVAGGRAPLISAASEPPS